MTWVELIITKCNKAHVDAAEIICQHKMMFVAKKKKPKTMKSTWYFEAVVWFMNMPNNDAFLYSLSIVFISWINSLFDVIIAF